MQYLRLTSSISKNSCLLYPISIRVDDHSNWNRAKDAALLHLFTHAFFKAGLFLAAGSVMHALSHQLNDQKIRRKTFVTSEDCEKLPVTFIVFCITGASLAGLPMPQVFSKDSILTAWNLSIPSAQFILRVWFWLYRSWPCFYTFRLIRFVFFGNESQTTVHESPCDANPDDRMRSGVWWFIVSVNPIHVSGWFINSFTGAETKLHRFQVFGSNSARGFHRWGVILLETAFLPKAIQFFKTVLGSIYFIETTIGLQSSQGLFPAVEAQTKACWRFLHFIAYTQVSGCVWNRMVW